MYSGRSISVGYNRIGTDHVIRVCLPSQSEFEKHNQDKPTNLCAPHKFIKNVSAMFDNHIILTIE